MKQMSSPMSSTEPDAAPNRGRVILGISILALGILLGQCFDADRFLSMLPAVVGVLMWAVLSWRFGRWLEAVPGSRTDGSRTNLIARHQRRSNPFLILAVSIILVSFLAVQTSGGTADAHLIGCWIAATLVVVAGVGQVLVGYAHELHRLPLERICERAESGETLEAGSSSDSIATDKGSSEQSGWRTACKPSSPWPSWCRSSTWWPTPSSIVSRARTIRESRRRSTQSTTGWPVLAVSCW